MNTAATPQPNWIYNYSTKTQLPPLTLLQHKLQMNCQIQQEEKRGMKKTHNIYYLQHRNLKTIAPKLIAGTLLPLKTQKNIAWLKHKIQSL